MTEVRVKNMFSKCCIILLKEKLQQNKIPYLELKLGSIKVQFNKHSTHYKRLVSLLETLGFQIINDREEQLVEDIKMAVIELVHELNNVSSIIRKSDYLVEKLGLSYQHLSKVFSSKEHITLEKYIILQKIERIKELIHSQEYTLSEIAFIMDYSSVQYLSNQFKSITGMSVTEYKNTGDFGKKPLEHLY